MKNRIALLNTLEFPCPGSHLLHARKLLSSLSRQGFHYLEISDKQPTEVQELGEGDLVYISNHGLVGGAPSSLQIGILEKLAKSGVIPIFWFWHEHAGLLDSLFGSRWILTGEHLRAQNVLPSHEEYSRITRSRSNFVPSRFASALPSNQVGTIPRANRFNASFVGHRYQRVLNFKLAMSLPKVKVVYTPPFISEVERVNLFTSSHIVLGWHSASNIVNGNVVVITDNPYALEATDGHVLFADTYSQTKEHFDRVIKDVTFRNRLQENGISWSRAHGTYESVAASFVTHARAL
jgi:hypothetical protein